MAKTAEQKREYAREYARKRRASDPVFLERCREAGRKARNNRKNVALAESAKWKAENKEKVSEYNKQYAIKNSGKIKDNRIKRTQEKKHQYQKVSKDWKEKNKEEIKKYQAEYTAKRYESDPIFRLKLLQRTRIRAAIKRQKTLRTNELLGCSYEQLKQHIESLFVDGMNWQNMGDWHIDHIIPLAAFDLSQEVNQKMAFHYSNLQPLWAADNLKKGAKYA